MFENGLSETKKEVIFAAIGEMAEWSNAAVLKTVEGHTSGGSNPSFSATYRVDCLVIEYIVEYIGNN